MLYVSVLIRKMGLCVRVNMGVCPRGSEEKLRANSLTTVIWLLCLREIRWLLLLIAALWTFSEMSEIFPTNKTAVCVSPYPPIRNMKRLVASQRRLYSTVTHPPSPVNAHLRQTWPQRPAENQSALCRETCFGNASRGYVCIKIPVSACSNPGRLRMFSSQAAGLTCRYASCLQQCTEKCCPTQSSHTEHTGRKRHNNTI